MAAGGILAVEWMTDLCKSIIAEGRIPTDWTKSTLVPLYKGKGDPLSVDHIGRSSCWSRE